MKLTWPVPVYPYQDELLSSWLVRAALVHGCEPMSLTSALWPGWRSWTMDIDRYLVEERLQSLSLSSGLRRDEISVMTLLHHLDGRVFINGRSPSLLSWVIAIGSRNRQHKMGVQCCPDCLRASEPYFRWQWRLAWYTCCPEHQRELVGNCPACQTPIQYHRVSAQTPHIGICFSCGYDFRGAETPRVETDKIGFQELASRVFESGTVDWGTRQIPSVDWFVLVKLLINLIRRSVTRHLHAHSHVADFVQSTGIDLASIQLPPTRLSIELLPITQREPLFAAAAHMLSLGSDDLLQLLKDSGVSRNTLIDNMSACPDSLTDWLSGLPDNRVQHPRRARHLSHLPKSKEVVRYEWARLLRRQGLLP